MRPGDFVSKREHATIAPSSLHRLVPCPGSLAMSAPFADRAQSEAAAEGEAGHWVAYCYALYAQGEEITLPVLGDKTPNGIAVDEDMLDGAAMYVEALEHFEGTAETMVNIPSIHAEQCFGTPDFWQYHEPSRTLRITDYKYGKRYVEVFENYQLAAYASGIMDSLKLDDQATVVEFLIVQPRCYHQDGPVRSWTAGASMLRNLINQCHHAAGLALSSAPPLRTGAHCLDCPAAGNCVPLAKAGAAVLEFADTVELVSMSPAEVGVRLSLIEAGRDVLRAIAAGLEEQALGHVRAGKPVPNWHLGHSNPRQIWNVPMAQVKALGQLYGLDLVKEEPALTPKQAITKKIPKGLVDKLSFTPNGKARLEQDSTVRTRKIFSK